MDIEIITEHNKYDIVEIKKGVMELEQEEPFSSNPSAVTCELVGSSYIYETFELNDQSDKILYEIWDLHKIAIIIMDDDEDETIIIPMDRM